MSAHTFKRVYRGSGIEGRVTPTCFCGWIGRTEYAWNDWQMTNVAKQETEHLFKSASDRKERAMDFNEREFIRTQT